MKQQVGFIKTMNSVSIEMNIICDNESTESMEITETILENSHADLSIEFTYHNLTPPCPPIDEEIIIAGEFNYVNSTSTRIMLQNAYQAITSTETWEFVKKDIQSFMLSTSPEILRITEKMEKLGYSGHSGCSFGWTMRQMQYIAKNGEEEYKKLAVEY